MPYCLECGAKYTAGAVECPMCGAPTDQQDAGDVTFAARDTAPWTDSDDSDATVDPIDRLIDLRREVIRLSAALRRLSDEDYAAQSPGAIDVRDRLAAALDELDLLPLDGEVGEARDLVATAARHLLQSFDVMMQLSWPGATLDEATRAEAQSEVGEATRALRTAGELLATLFGEEAVAGDGLDEEAEEKAATPANEADRLARPAMRDSFDLQLADIPEEPEDTPTDEPRARPEPIATAPAPPSTPPFAAEREPSGDPLGETLEWEVLNRWAQHRVTFYRRIDEAVQAALSDAVRVTLDVRARAQRDVERHIERLQHQRRALLDEIEALRQERERLRDETAQLRIELERLEHARMNTESEAQQMLRDARVQRARLLGEIETLTKQLSELHRTVQSLPGFERSGRTMRRPSPHGETPASSARTEDVEGGRRQTAMLGAESRLAALAVETPDTDIDALAHEVEAPTSVAPTPVEPPGRPPVAPPVSAAGRPPVAPTGEVASPPQPTASEAGARARVETTPAQSPAPTRPAVPLRPRPTPQPPAPAPEPVAAMEPGDAGGALADLLRNFQPGEVGTTLLSEPQSGEDRSESSTEERGEALSAASAAHVEAAEAVKGPQAAPRGPWTTEIRIIGQNVIRQRPQLWMAVKGLDGVRSVLPRVEEGALVLRVQHERGPDLIEDLTNLRGMNLKLVSASFPERVELSI